MNERIKELAEQADITLISTDFTGCLKDQNFLVTNRNLTERQLYKFAELIVKECSAFVYNYPEKYLTRNQAREISLSMEEHFGVKE